MRKKKILHSLLVLVSLLSLTGFRSHQQADDLTIRITQVDTSAFPDVTVYVSVTDAEGDPVGVDPARIRLMENGEQIPVDQIQGAGEVDPLTVLLAMDISGSMLYVGKLDAAKTAAKAFVDQLRPADRVGLLTFHTEFDYVQPITEDRERIYNAIEGLEAKEDTAMYDALGEAIQILEEVAGRKAIVAVTDGLDTVSTSTPEAVLRQIGPTGLSISTIGLGDASQDLNEKTALDVDALTYLAENAGGVYAYAEDEESLTSIYQSYAAAFRSEYQLTYTSPSTLRDGVNRALTVSLAESAQTAVSVEDFSISYNPGGLVPEVSEPVPLMTFGAVMLFLILVFFLPTLITFVVKPIRDRSTPGKTGGRKKPRIKLLD